VSIFTILGSTIGRYDAHLMSILATYCRGEVSGSNGIELWYRCCKHAKSGPYLQHAPCDWYSNNFFSLPRLQLDIYRQTLSDVWFLFVTLRDIIGRVVPDISSVKYFTIEEYEIHAMVSAIFCFILLLSRCFPPDDS
jgi:hypothetical protein